MLNKISLLKTDFWYVKLNTVKNTELLVLHNYQYLEHACNYVITFGHILFIKRTHL